MKLENLREEFPPLTLFKVPDMGDDSLGFRYFELPKEGNKTKNCAESEYWQELQVRAQADWCVSLTPPGF